MTQILSPSRVSFNPNMLHPSVEECRSAVAHVLSQPEFLGSNRLREFLRFVAERTLAGRGDTLKATAIAVAVFGRDETFDAHANPIVRVEATRLRKALRNYYEKRGANDSVEISLPVGSYAPVFLRRDASASMRVPARPVPEPETKRERPRSPRFWRPAWLVPAALAAGVAGVALLGVIVTSSTSQPLPGAGAEAPARASIAPVTVAELRPILNMRPFDADSRAPADYAVAGLLERDILQALRRFDALVLRSELSSAGDDHAPQRADYELEGRLESAPPALTLRLRGADGQDVWITRYPLKSRDLSREERSELVRAVVARIAYPAGVLEEDMHARLKMGMGLTPGLECFSHAADFQSLGEEAARRSAYACLTAALAGSGDPVLPSVLLADLHFNSYIANDMRLGAEPPLNAAEGLAMRAIAAGPERALGYSTLAMILHLKGRNDAAIEIAHRALAINPLDAQAMATLGAIEISNGDYRGGADVLTRVLEEHPRFPSWIRFYLFLDAFDRGDLEAQTRIVAASDRPEAPLSILARALSAASAGNRQMAHEAFARLRLAAPALAADPAGALQRMRLDDAMVAKLTAGLKTAGF